ncbi:MAG: copper resistance protein NlpE N-terminal domain-containing protein [Phocaeicola sp.]
MKKRKLFTTAAALFTFAAVSTVVLLNSHKQPEPATTLLAIDSIHSDLHTAENSLDYWGTYKGSLPTTGSTALEITLILHKEKNFELIQNQLEPTHTLTDQGSYHVSGNLLTLQGESTNYYRIGENRLIKLGADKEPITDSQSQPYILTKNQD